jgi:hypothetical protein
LGGVFGTWTIAANIAYYRLITPDNGFFQEKKIVYFLVLTVLGL